MKDKEKDQGDQELIKQQKADQQKSGDGQVEPLSGDLRIPEQKK